jgi:Mrp family chromosome partitioning ATPase
VALSLAESFARNGQKTLLVDADLRAPVLGKEYNLNSQTVTPLISYFETFYQEDAPVAVPLGPSQNLEVIPSFEAAPNPTELLARASASAWTPGASATRSSSLTRRPCCQWPIR